MFSAPKREDPKETAAAQTQSNVSTAVANAFLNNAQTRGFDGNTTSNQIIGYEQIDDGKGGKIQVPRFSVDNQLSPENQWLYSQRQHLTSIGQDAAIQAMHRINANARTDLDFSDNPAAGTVAAVPTLDRVGGGPQLQDSIARGSIQAGLGNAGQIQTGLNPISQQIASTVDLTPLSGTFKTDFASAGPVPTVGGGGFNQNYRGYQDEGNVPGLQSTYRTQNAQGTFDDAGPMARNVALNRVGADFAGGGQVQTSLGPQDWSEDRRRVEDAIYSRLDPAFDRQQVGLEERLRNQGLVEGTEAWNRRIDELGRQRNDARMQTILAGGQEQSRLAALAQMQGQFANQAQAQQFEQARQRGLFGITATGFNNDAAIAEGNFQNTAQAQAFQQAMGRGAFANQTIAQNNQTARDLAAFNNQARQQEQQFGLGKADLDIRAMQAGNATAAQMGALQLQAQQQQFNQNVAQSAFYNDALARQNALAAQNNEFTLSQAGFQNAAQQQAFAQSLAGGQFANQAQQQQFAQNLAGGQFANQAQAQDFEQAAAQAAFGNQARQQGYQNELTQAGFNNQAAGQTFNMQQAAFDAQNNLRERSIQEELIRRNQITNEWAAINSGTQMQLPQAQQFRAAQIANVDYSNIVNQAYQTEMNAYTAQMNGMFGIGNTVMRGMFGGFGR